MRQTYLRWILSAVTLIVSCVGNAAAQSLLRLDKAPRVKADPRSTSARREVLLLRSASGSSIRSPPMASPTPTSCSRISLPSATAPAANRGFLGSPHLPGRGLADERHLPPLRFHHLGRLPLGRWSPELRQRRRLVRDPWGYGRVHLEHDRALRGLHPGPQRAQLHRGQPDAEAPPYIAPDIADEALALVGAVVGYKLQVSPAPPTATFGDVPTGHQFFQYIEALADVRDHRRLRRRQLLSGQPGDTRADGRVPREGARPAVPVARLKRAPSRPPRLVVGARRVPGLQVTA